jgi:4-amino-4-deoxy-L-arabinose transferase-like glycosyltransferase
VGRVQATLVVVSVLVFFLLASRFLRPGWSHAATLLMGTSPHLANLETNLLSETLFLFCLLASALATVRAFERPGRLAFVLAGVSWGLCALVRPTVVAMPVLLLAACWLAPRLRALRVPSLWLCVAFVLVQSPWFVRNQVADLDPAQGNLLLWSVHHGSYPGFLYEGRPETLGWPFRADPNSLQAERSWSNLMQDLGAKLRAQPMQMARWYLLGKPGTFLSWGHIQGVDIYVYEPTRTPWRERPAFALLRAVALLLHWPLMLGGVVAALLAWWRPGWLRLEGGALVAARLVSAIVLYAIAAHMLVAPYPRYGVPFRPFLQALALAWLAAPFTARPRPQTS